MYVFDYAAQEERKRAFLKTALPNVGPGMAVSLCRGNPDVCLPRGMLACPACALIQFDVSLGLQDIIDRSKPL